MLPGILHGQARLPHTAETVQSLAYNRGGVAICGSLQAFAKLGQKGTPAFEEPAERGVGQVLRCWFTFRDTEAIAQHEGAEFMHRAKDISILTAGANAGN